MAYDERFVSQRAYELLAEAGSRRIPIDLCSLGRHRGVHTLRLEPIVPAGIVAADEAGFTIHLRSRSQFTFSLLAETRVKLSVRQRFTLAHEIVHTFFYRRERGRPEAIKGAPRGRRLERLCRYGAGLLVVPGNFLRGLLGPGGRFASAAQAAALCKRFVVSPEVLLRRVAEDESLIENDSAIIFGEVGPGDDDARILAACYDGSLIAYLSRPKLYSGLREWLGAYLEEDFSPCRARKWWRPMSDHEGLRFMVTPWRERAGTFFLEVKFCLL